MLLGVWLHGILLRNDNDETIYFLSFYYSSPEPDSAPNKEQKYGLKNKEEYLKQDRKEDKSIDQILAKAEQKKTKVKLSLINDIFPI